LGGSFKTAAGMSRAKKVLANIGKFVIFSLLMGLGALLLAAIMTDVIIHNWTWIFGKTTEGSTYAAIVTAALDGYHIHHNERIWLGGVCTRTYLKITDCCRSAINAE
jgi:hypothetical protein